MCRRQWRPIPRGDLQIKPLHREGDFVQALHTPAAGGVYLLEEIRKLGCGQGAELNLPPWIEELTNQGICSSLGISVETVKNHVVNAMDTLGAADRTKLAVMAMLYGLIDPFG